jgi:hypothetical protein
MSLLTEAEALTSKVGGTCTVKRLLDRLPPEERAELVEALASEVETTALSKALLRRDVDISSHTLRRHRRRECRCPA